MCSNINMHFLKLVRDVKLTASAGISFHAFISHSLKRIVLVVFTRQSPARLQLTLPNIHRYSVGVRYDTIRYDTRCCFSVRPELTKARWICLLPHGTSNWKVEKRKDKMENKNRGIFGRTECENGTAAVRLRNKVSHRERRDDMRPADGSSIQKSRRIYVRTSLVGRWWISCRQPACL